MAQEIFGQSDLPRDDLMKIWYANASSFRSEKRLNERRICTRRNLADIDNRGKLNLAEFHVAMGLIYRRGFSLLLRRRLEQTDGRDTEGQA